MPRCRAQWPAAAAPSDRSPAVATAPPLPQPCALPNLIANVPPLPVYPVPCSLPAYRSSLPLRLPFSPSFFFDSSRFFRPLPHACAP